MRKSAARRPAARHGATRPTPMAGSTCATIGSCSAWSCSSSEVRERAGARPRGDQWPRFVLTVLQHLLHKRAALEEIEVFHLLARADEARGDAEFVLNRHHTAAFAAAVEFGDDDAG